MRKILIAIIFMISIAGYAQRTETVKIQQRYPNLQEAPNIDTLVVLGANALQMRVNYSDLFSKMRQDLQNAGIGPGSFQNALETPYNPYLTIGSTNVQDALNELKDEVDALSVGGGTGDMLKTTYDANSDNIVDNAEKLGNQSPGYYLDNTDTQLTQSEVGAYAAAEGFLKTEADPVFSAWDKSTGITIQESQISDLNHTVNTDNQTASEVASNAYLTISATNVQAALEELKDEVDALSVGGGTGDMLRTTYDTNGDDVVDNSAALGGNTANYFTDRGNHTGTQLANTISDFETAVSSNNAVSANTAKVSADGSVGTHSNVDLSGISDGQILKWNSADNLFKPAPDEAGSGGSTYTFDAPLSESGGAVSLLDNSITADKLDLPSQANSQYILLGVNYQTKKFQFYNSVNSANYSSYLNHTSASFLKPNQSTFYSKIINGISSKNYLINNGSSSPVRAFRFTYTQSGQNKVNMLAADLTKEGVFYVYGADKSDEYYTDYGKIALADSNTGTITASPATSDEHLATRGQIKALTKVGEGLLEASGGGGGGNPSERTLSVDYTKVSSFKSTSGTQITEIDLSKNNNYYTGLQQGTVTTYTTTGAIVGGCAIMEIDLSGATTYPTVSGATLIKSPDFEQGIVTMTVYSLNGTQVKYFFTKNQ